MLETNLKQLRAERGMDQAELAALVGVRRETINRLDPSLKLALDVAHVFGKTVEEVFSFREET